MFKNLMKAQKGGKGYGLFLGGVLFGTAGIKLLASDDAKKVYTNIAAAGLRVKDSVLKTATKVQENAGDIMAGAEEINEERKANKNVDYEVE